MIFVSFLALDLPEFSVIFLWCKLLYFLWQFSFADLVYDGVLGSQGFNNEPMVFMCTWGGVQSVGLGFSNWSLSPTHFRNLTDVSLADEDTNSIPTDYADRTISGNIS